MIKYVAAALLSAAVVASSGWAGESYDLRRLFPYEADIFADRDGLVRLELPAAVLGACRGGLADLRVFDGEWHEVPYLVDARPPRGEVVELVQSQAAAVVEARREEVAREGAPPLYRETYVVEVPPEGQESWNLVFDARGPFVRRLDVAMVEGDLILPVVAGGSIFRLASPPAEKVRIDVPAMPGSRLMVTIEGEGGGYLEPALRFESRRRLGTHDKLRVKLEQISREERDGRTIIELARPRGLVPDALHLRADADSFDRAVEVWDEGPGIPPTRLGRAELFRMAGFAVAEQSEVAIEPPRGDRLRVEIQNGDSPPFGGVVVEAVVRQPVLLFYLRGAGDAPAGHLLFGGGRAQAPRYDLARLTPKLGEALGIERAAAVATLYDPAQAGKGWLGEIRPNPAYDQAPALAFAMHPGSTVNRSVYTHRRALGIRPPLDGLTRLALTAADAAAARPDFADLRVVDQTGRQWPYLLQPGAVHLWERVGVGNPKRRRRHSRYDLLLPAAPIVVDQVELDAAVPFFDRGYRLVGRRADDDTEITLSQGRLALRAERPRPVVIGFPAARVKSLRLEVDDGDEAPLAFRAARVRTSAPELFLVAPAGQYELLVGNAAATVPRYDLDRVRDVVLGVHSGEASMGQLEPNPGYSRLAPLVSAERAGSLISQVVLWAVLAGAVVVLTAVTLRLVRGKPDDEPPA